VQHYVERPGTHLKDHRKRESFAIYASGVHSTTHVRRISAGGRLGVSPSVADLARTVPRRWRRTLQWREGTRTTLSGRFSFCRVKTTHSDGTSIDRREAQWLAIKWPATKGVAPKFYLTTLPRRMSHKKIIEIIKERWRTDRSYEDLEGEPGLDHFEGRSFPGWHHHVSVVVSCYAFVVAERARVFPPPASGIGEKFSAPRCGRNAVSASSSSLVRILCLGIGREFSPSPGKIPWRWGSGPGGSWRKGGRLILPSSCRSARVGFPDYGPLQRDNRQAVGGLMVLGGVSFSIRGWVVFGNSFRPGLKVLPDRQSKEPVSVTPGLPRTLEQQRGRERRRPEEPDPRPTSPVL